MAARVKDLVGRLTTAEKIPLLMNHGAPVPRLGIAQYRWGTECLHGVVKKDWSQPHGVPPTVPPWAPPGGGATVFPQPLGTAASFDKELLGKMGVAMSTEARGLNNGGGSTGGTPDSELHLSCWAPNILLDYH